MQEALALISSPLGWVIYFSCAILIGMSKAGIQNIGALTVPLFALLFGAKYSTGIVLILLCIADLVAVIYYRKTFLWNEVKKLLPLAFVGLLAGLFIGNYIDDKSFKTIMAICIIIGLLIMLFFESINQNKQATIVNKKWYSPIFGFILGISTMIGNAAGPVLSVYMLSKKLDKISFAATSAWFIILLNVTKIPLQAFVWKNLSWSGFYLNLMAIPFILIGGYIGIKLVQILPEKLYKNSIKILLFISCIILLIT